LTDGLIAYENIWNRGYRRIGLVSSVRVRTRFGAGYLFRQTQLSPHQILPPLLLTDTNSTQDQQQLVAWLKKSKPDAILTDIGPLRDMLAAAGRRVPQDIGLAALSVLDGNADAGIDQKSEEIGKAAVQLLISLIHLNERGIPATYREVLIPGRWQDGSTLPQHR
jgi:LacI family transcriptional regulator